MTVFDRLRSAQNPLLQRSQNGHAHEGHQHGETWFDPHHLSDAEVNAQARALEEWRQTEGAEVTTGGVIDVHVHVINKGAGAANGDVSQKVIDEQMRVLNDRFEGTGWSFRLVDVDRTTNAGWYAANPNSRDERAMKNSLHEGGADDLNLYFNAPAMRGLMGWATFPSWFERAPKMDGVVVRNATMPGGAITVLNEGETLVHEVGHWMGLYHTFQGGCGRVGDEVADTPAEARPGERAEPGRDTCPDDPGVDPIQNYMDYSYDAMRTEFSRGQDRRMDEMFSAFRVGK
jgi:hypothetical protein